MPVMMTGILRRHGVIGDSLQKHICHRCVFGDGVAMVLMRMSAWCQASAAISCGMSACNTTSNPSGTIRLAWLPFGPWWTSKLTI